EVQLCSQGGGPLCWGPRGERRILQPAPGTAGRQDPRSSHGSWAVVRLAPSGSPAGGDAPGSPSPPSPPILLLGVGESSGGGIRREPIPKLSLEPRVPFVFLGSGGDALVAILSFWPRLPCPIGTVGGQGC
ncbi:hypothetical protein LEMLEM_LOCUS19884, partial [Lemmus lemmus]